MNNTNLNCSLNDTAVLRNLILENPELPLLIFCGEDSWHDEYPYEQADASSGEIKELHFTMIGGWIKTTMKTSCQMIYAIKKNIRFYLMKNITI